MTQSVHSQPIKRTTAKHIANDPGDICIASGPKHDEENVYNFRELQVSANENVKRTLNSLYLHLFNYEWGRKASE